MKVEGRKESREYLLNGTTIQHNDQEKDLGIITQKYLKLWSHCTAAVK